MDQQNYELCMCFKVSFFLLADMPFADEPSTFSNAPVSIQVVGRTLEEEALIAMSEIVDNALKHYGSNESKA
jgi:hypothetical protein